MTKYQYMQGSNNILDLTDYLLVVCSRSEFRSELAQSLVDSGAILSVMVIDTAKDYNRHLIAKFLLDNSIEVNILRRLIEVKQYPSSNKILEIMDNYKK